MEITRDRVDFVKSYVFDSSLENGFSCQARFGLLSSLYLLELIDDDEYFKSLEAFRAVS